MSRSGAQQSPNPWITVGDFDPEADRGVEFDFIGRKIAGRYTVRAQIGGGGMADVYRATDEQLGIDVALKLLKPRMASDELRARMVQEAQAAARVRHPNLVRVFGTGALDSTAYIAMELLEGPNLEQYLHEYRGGRMPCHEALELLLPALEALHEIHERGYVHRDIKTGNIIVARSPGRPATAIVIDLGLIKPDRALRNAASPPTTEVGRMLCTPGYTSPEQAAGKPVDRRSDVYSMAVTLYRVLAGRLPFKEARGQPLALLARHIYNIPTMLAEAAGTARVPDAVAVVIERALSKDPARRPQTMLAFADELRAVAPAMCPPTAARLRRARDIALGFGVAVLLGWFIRPPPTCPPAVACTDVPVLEFAAPSSPVVIPAVAQPAPHVDEPAAGDAARRPPVERDDSSVGSARRGARPRTAAYVRALAGRTAQVRACAGVAGGALASLTVEVHIERSGQVTTRLIGEPRGVLSRCVDAALQQLPIAPPPAPVTLKHTFTLRPKLEGP